MFVGLCGGCGLQEVFRKWLGKTKETTNSVREMSGLCPKNVWKMSKRF
jgi:hypothetical protein